MRKSLNWLKNSVRALLMAAKPLLKSLKRSMSTKQGPLIYLAKCWPQCQSFPCSNQKHSSFSKSKKRRNQSSTKPCTTSRTTCLQPMTVRWNTSVVSATSSAARSSQKSVNNARLSKLNLPQLESRHLLCQDLTPTCHPIFRFHVPTVALLRSNLRNLELRCAISSSLSSKRSSIDHL